MTKPLAPALTLTLALASPGCGEAVDLGGTSDGTSDWGPVVESDEEGVLANIREHPDFLINDGDRLYWVGHVSSLADHSTMWIRSCRKADCARSVITYITAPFVTWLEVSAGELYFRPLDHASSELADPIATRVLSCPTSGCIGDPRVVVEAAEIFTIAGDSIFFTSTAAEPPGIYQKPLWGGDATLVVEVDAPLSRILVRNDQLFWSSRQGVLQRTSLGGKRRVETLLDDPRRTTWKWGLSLTSDPEAVYWSTYDLTSDIQRCPLVGCPSGPEVVAAPLRMPTSVLVSEGHLYMNVELPSSEVGLVSCSPFDCASAKLLGTTVGRGFSTIATDERFVYAFSNQGFYGDVEVQPGQYDDTSPGDRVLSSLRRYRK